MIACGKTRPTLEMTEQARHYLSSMQPRSLDLWLCFTEFVYKTKVEKSKQIWKKKHWKNKEKNNV